jgi:hypothetical protein
MSKQEALSQALEQARAALAGVDLPARLARLSLPAPQAGVVGFRLFGQEALLTLADLDLRLAATGAPAKPADRILVLHYLRHEGAVAFADRLVPFRDFPGGAFYLAPFRSRTVDPLVARYGNDLDSLRRSLSRFDSAAVPLGDLGARLEAFGPLSVTLIYQRGDDELGPSAEMLFDASVRRVFGADDAAALASRICLGLLGPG